MAIARDASSPARFNITNNAGGGESGTSASFTPPNSSLLRLSVCINAQAGATPTYNLPTNTGTGVGTWTLVKSQTNASGGAVAIYQASVTTGSATTVTIALTTCGSSGAGVDAAAWVDVWTGAAASQTGAATQGGTSTTQNLTTSTLSTAGSGSQIHGVGVDWAATGVPTSSDSNNSDGYTVATQTSGERVWKAANSGGIGSSVSVNLNAGGASPAWTYALAEILSAAAADTLMGQVCT
jgi:hypothetical protein